MNEAQEYTTLQHDLGILVEMANHMQEYLISDATDWTIPRVNMPKLTIGGYLMRQQRLCALRERLTPDDQQLLDTAVATFEDALTDRIVRFEQRSHHELRARLREWVGYLRDLSCHTAAQRNHYIGIVDTRVVIQALMDRLQQRPYQLEAGIDTEVAGLDRNLQARWTAGAFVWDPIWQNAYPRADYWYLWGCPKTA